jgi:flagellar biogenesis protein FliO
VAARRWLLAAVVTASLAMPAAAAPGQSRPASGESGASRPARLGRGASRPAASRPAGSTRPGTPLDIQAGQSGRGLAYKMIAYTLLILVLGGVALVVSRRWLPKLTRSTGKSISVLETVYLGPRKSLHLLQVGSQRFLVAGSRENLSMLGEVTGAFDPAELAESAEASRSDGSEAGLGGLFAGLLRQRTKEAETGEAEPDAPAGKGADRG